MANAQYVGMTRSWGSLASGTSRVNLTQQAGGVSKGRIGGNARTLPYVLQPGRGRR
jgi:hypothetical protein